MKLTVLGKYGPYPAPGGACSGYLIQEGNTRVLVDCGAGVISRLQQFCSINDLDAIVLSHLHSDHMADLLVLRYALEIMNAKGLREARPLPLYAPENPREEFSVLSNSSVYGVQVIKDGMKLQIGELEFAFTEMTHPVQSFGMSIKSGEKRLVYTGDTSLNPRVEELARGADFFFGDTGLLHADKGPKAVHLTAREIGEIAKAAGVKKLMVTHFWPGYREEDVVREARSVFPETIGAEEMKSYEI